MERLTSTYWKNNDPWEMCGLGEACNRTCVTNGEWCKVAIKLRHLAAYEDTDLTPEQITAMQKENAENRKKIADGRMVELPEGYEHATEFWHVIDCPFRCNENGDWCDSCKYNDDDECTFNPYASRIGRIAVYKAIRTLNKLKLTREAAEAAKAGEGK